MTSPRHQVNAPSPAGARRPSSLPGLCVLSAAFIVLAIAFPTTASAAFTRHYVCQITGRAGAEASETECNGSHVGNSISGGFTPSNPSNLATDASADLLVGQQDILKFDPAGNLLARYEAESETSLAVSFSNGDLYAARDFEIDVLDKGGSLTATWPSSDDALHVAVDNATDLGDPNAGDVYVAEKGTQITLLNPAGEPVKFKGTAPYISENHITGTPSGSFAGVFRTPWALAVDTHGDVFALTDPTGEATIDEFNPEGIFQQSFPVDNRLPAEAIAIDPTNDHLLIAEGYLGGGAGVVREFASSGRFLNSFATSSPGASLTSAVSIATAPSGDVYVDDPASGVIDKFSPGAYLATLGIEAATERTPTTATLNGTVDPEAETDPEPSGLTDCRFEYTTGGEYEAEGFGGPGVTSAPCESPDAAEVPDADSPVAVHAAVSGFLSGTTYRYRLATTTEGALGGVARSEPRAFTVPHAPRVGPTFVDNVSSSFADLHARLDPLGAPTSYRFQYLTVAQFEAQGGFAGAALQQTHEVEVGSGGASGATEAVVLQHLHGLVAATAYEFRILATNECEAVEHPGTLCVGESEPNSFTTLAAPTVGLPDNRAYELLTPPDKEGAEDMFGSARLDQGSYDVGISSSDGNRFLLDTTAAFGPFPTSGEDSYIFTRSEHGWSFVSAASPDLGVQSLAAEQFDPSFSKLALVDRVGSAPAGTQNLNLLGPPGGPYTTIYSAGAFSGEAAFFVGASTDLSHLVLETSGHQLCPGDGGQDPGTDALCEYSAGKLSLLNVNSEGKLLSRCGARLGYGGSRGDQREAVSADGTRVLFTTPDPEPEATGAGCWNGGSANTPQLYMREDGQTTFQLSAPDSGVTDPTGAHPAVFVGASANASRVFFRSEAELTPDDQGIHDRELYEWQAPGPGGCSPAAPSYNPTSKGCLTRISRGESASVEAGVAFVPAVSSDGSAVYFTATGQLAPGAPATAPGELDLYRYDTEAEAVSYVATIFSSDYPEHQTNQWWPGGHEIALDQSANWETTDDGRYLIFASSHGIAGYSTAAAPGIRCPLLSQGTSPNCTEVYRYDAAAPRGQQIVCVSCNPTGAPPVSDALFARSADEADKPAGAPPRAISEDGSYVFFDTADPLVPDDSNGKIDVYEWHDGHISLISSGRDSADSLFLDSSTDGSNVFFGTHARLVPADTDGAGDLYDARICTASDPCIGPVASGQGLCEGDACSRPLPAPDDPTPGSLTYRGPGNRHPTRPRRCPKGRALRHGRCLAARQHKARRRNRRRAGRAAAIWDSK